MIDTHAHLNNQFGQEVNLDKLKWVVLSSGCLKDSKDNLELARVNPKYRPAIGIHPQEIEDNPTELEKLISDEVVAIGECGLEYADGVDRNKQITLFRFQIEMAQKYNKALIVHSREASDETVEILKSYQNLRGVIHCYTGGKKRINRFLEISDRWYFGIDGNITYEAGLSEVVKNIPKDRLVLETDTPFLAPIPHRGEQNKPEWVEFTYRKVAEIWNVNFEETEKLIDENAKRLFQIHL